MASVIKSFFSRDFEYSPFHRVLEILAILGFFVLVGIIAVRVAIGFSAYGWTTALWVVPLTALVGYLAADLVSGIVHWLGDTYGTEETPVLGDNFIKPFRDHHVEPEGICHHDFVEVNGNNSIVLALYMVPVAIFLSDPTQIWQFLFLSGSIFFTLGIFMTNQFHKWSHEPDPPGYIRTLQKWHLILPSDHHDVHHTAPFDTYYCITVGWMNPILQRLQILEGIERMLKSVFGIRTARDQNEAV